MNSTQAIRLDRTVGRAIYALHELLYRVTGGRVGHRAGNLTILLLTTRGRRTGRPRTCALAYLADGDDLVVVGSNAARPQHPQWYLNLLAEPRARVQVGNVTRDVVAEVAEGEARARLWRRLNDVYPNYEGYQQRTTRRIPVVVLHPAG